MKTPLMYVLAVLMGALAVTGCVKHEEVSFSGTVVGIKNCDMTYTDRNAGYIVQLETPEGVGGMVVSSSSDDTLRNVVVLYEPPRILQVSKRIYGKFYFDDKYSKATGCVTWLDENIENLPEGVITELKVEN